MRRTLGIAWLGLALVACGGGDDPDDDPPPFPAVAGTYNINGSFDGVASSFPGTVVLTQASREVADLGGTINVTANIGGSIVPIVGPLTASVTTTGVVTFVRAASGISWSFSGQLAGATVSGRHTLSGDGETYSGNFSMTRVASLRTTIRSMEQGDSMHALWEALNQ